MYFISMYLNVRTAEDNTVKLFHSERCFMLVLVFKCFRAERFEKNSLPLMEFSIIVSNKVNHSGALETGRYSPFDIIN